MTTSQKYTKSKLNSNIVVNNLHETRELNAVEKIAGMEALDPEVNALIEYNQKVFSNVCIVPLFDLHIGGEGTKLARIKKVIEFIKNTSNAVCLFGGDILDNATLMGATNAHTSKINPDRALDLAVKLFEPIKDKTLCVLAGNHDGTSGGRNKDSNMAPAKQFAKRLGIKYAPYNAIIKVNLKLKNAKLHKKDTITYNIFATHGSGKAGSKAATLDVALRKALSACALNNITPDLVLTGHFHADVDGIYDVTVPKYDDKGRLIGELQKSIRVESLATMQEANTYAVANGMDLTKSNNSAINICWLKNPYYYDKTQTMEWEYLAQSTKFPILRTQKDEFSKIALSYQALYDENDNLEEKLRNECKNKTVTEITKEIEIIR